MTSSNAARAPWISIVALFSTLLLSACGGPDAHSTPFATGTPGFSEVVVTPDDQSGIDPATATPSATPSPIATATVDAGPTMTTTSPPASTPDEPVATEVVEEPDSAMTLDEFHEALDALLAGIDGTVAVSLLAADGTMLYEMNSHEAMEAASLYKLPIMVEVFRQRDQGVLSFEDGIELAEMYFAEGEDSFSSSDIGAWVSIDTLLFAMIAQSSNVAAYALLDLVGTDSVNATMTELGLSGIEIRWRPVYRAPIEEAPETSGEAGEEPEEVDGGEEPVTDGESDNVDQIPEEPSDEETETPSGSAQPLASWMVVNHHTVPATVRGDAAFNVVNAAEVARLLLLMAVNDLINEETSQEMLNLLARQEIYGGLPALLPDGSVAHKTGYLPDGVLNDAGVIYTPSGPLVAVVLTEGVSESVAYDVMAQIGRLVYEYGS